MDKITLMKIREAGQRLDVANKRLLLTLSSLPQYRTMTFAEMLSIFAETTHDAEVALRELDSAAQLLQQQKD